MIAGINKQGVADFYGRRIPRPQGKVDPVGNLVKDPANPVPSANAAVLDWAMKADWQQGGSVLPRPVGSLPKKAVTPEVAFVVYKTAVLRQQHPDLPRKELKRLAEDEVTAEWSQLDEAEKVIFNELAIEDERRYKEELEEFQTRNPGWLEWHEKHLQRVREEKPGSKVALPKKPKPPLTPWMAYVQNQTQKKLESNPELKSGLELTVQVMKEASAKWRDLSDRSRGKWIRIAKADRKRFEEELEKCPPEYRQKLEAKAAKKAQRKAAKQQKKQVKPIKAVTDVPDKEEVADEQPADASPADDAEDMSAHEEAAEVTEPATKRARGLPSRQKRLSQMQSKEATPASKTRKGNKAAPVPETEIEDDEEKIAPPEPFLPPDVSDLSSSDSEDEVMEETGDGKTGETPGTQDRSVIGWPQSVAKSIVTSVSGFFARARQDQEPEETPVAANQTTGSAGIHVGRKVVCDFLNDKKKLVPFQGTVVSFDSTVGWYKVKYTDGDEQEYNDEELEPLLVPQESEEETEKSASKSKLSQSSGQKRKSRK